MIYRDTAGWGAVDASIMVINEFVRQCMVENTVGIKRQLHNVLYTCDGYLKLHLYTGFKCESIIFYIEKISHSISVTAIYTLILIFILILQLS